MESDIWVLSDGLSSEPHHQICTTLPICMADGE
jgi:hypothetical protein